MAGFKHLITGLWVESFTSVVAKLAKILIVFFGPFISPSSSDRIQRVDLRVMSHSVLAMLKNLV